MRSIDAALNAGKKAVALDFQLFDHAARSDGDLFFRHFARSISEQIEAAPDVDQFWDPGLTNPQNCTRYMEKQTLGRLNAPLTLAVDEADVIFGADFRADFFAMLRAWHGNRANPVKKVWRNLDLILVTSTEPYMFINRLHESPFNVGVSLRLEDFLPEQVQEVNRLHPNPAPAAEAEQLYGLLGGHPYLTRKALYHVAGERSLMNTRQLLEQAADDAGPFGDHLRYYLLRLHGKEELLQALRNVVHGGKIEDELLIFRLESAGLVKREMGRTVPRCRLYGEYFREHLH